MPGNVFPNEKVIIDPSIRSEVVPLLSYVVGRMFERFRLRLLMVLGPVSIMEDVEVHFISQSEKVVRIEWKYHSQLSGNRILTTQAHLSIDGRIENVFELE